MYVYHADADKMYLCADCFVTDSQADVQRQSDSSLIFLLSLKERKLPRKRDYQGRFSITFLKDEIQILSLTGRKNPTNVLKIYAEA